MFSLFIVTVLYLTYRRRKRFLPPPPVFRRRLSKRGEQRFSGKTMSQEARTMGRNCGEIFHKYSQLFGGAYESEKYAVSHTKLSKKGFDDDDVWKTVGYTDKLPVNVEMHDEHALSEFQGSGSAMDISALHSGEKKKLSHSGAKGKKKLDSRSALSESVEKLANVGNELIAAQLKANSGPPSIDACMEELDNFSLLEDDEKFHLFALSFLDQKRHRASYTASCTPQMKMKFLKFNFKTWCLKNAGAFDD